MTAYHEAKALLMRNLELLDRPRTPDEVVPINEVLYGLSKALLLLTESLESDLAEIMETTAKLQPPQE